MYLCLFNINPYPGYEDIWRIMAWWEGRELARAT
ncbi:uncharacterized protein METZ01_LOCUS136135 [marine metagenome]|uniref:Uncharacterized protein n=1 Tax=marine metagenome TaxID=408172 RepID=A0A381Z2Y3_9ZZZZ